MDLSVVVPLFNEEENVEELTLRILTSLENTELLFEVLFVDDGSTDGTVDRLKTIAASDGRVRAIQLRRNYGQTPAMRAGIQHAKGTTIVTMDGDLQNDPDDIPALLAKLEEGYDLVAGWRFDRKDPFLSRRLPSKIANWIIGRVTGVPMHDNGCSLKVYRAETIKRVPLYSEMHRFIPAVTRLAGGRIAEVVVQHHPRLRGQSKYGISRTGKVVLDLMTVKMLLAFSQRPLYLFGLLSIPFALLSGLTGVHALFSLFPIEGTPVPVVFPSVCVLLGYLAINFIAIGLLGELIVKTGKPLDFLTVFKASNVPHK